MPTTTMGIVPVVCLAGSAAVVLNATMSIGLAPHQFSGQPGKPIRPPIGIVSLYGEVLSLRVTKVVQSLQEGGEHVEDGSESSERPGDRKAIRGIFVAGCACAASAHATAAPPNNVMK